MTSLEAWLADQSANRRSAGLERRLVARGPADDVVDLAGNDYLGLSQDPRVRSAAAEAAREWGAGATASRLVTGTLTVHDDLERELAAFTGRDRALVFSSGYLANLGAVTALADRDTLVISDAHVHASLVDACRLARAQVRVVGHNDTAAVAEALANREQPRALVVVESVYSVLGDTAPVSDLVDLCVSYDATLLIDEAHAIGVAGPGGRGLAATLPESAADGVVLTVTLSKSLGSQGGAVLGPAVVVDHLVNTARSFIFDTALAPTSAAAALEALCVLRTTPALPDRVLACAAELAASCGVPAPGGAVLSVPMPGPGAAVAAQEAAARRGVRIGAFRPPSVPDGVSRLRITAHAGLDEAAMARAVGVLRDVVTSAGGASVGAPSGANQSPRATGDDGSAPLAERSQARSTGETR